MFGKYNISNLNLEELRNFYSLLNIHFFLAKLSLMIKILTKNNK